MPDRPKVLVTGANGFLGRAALRALASADCDITGTHRGSVPNDPSVGWVRTDLTDKDAIDDLCETQAPSHLLALAWYMGPGNQQAMENFRWIQHSIDLLFAFAKAGGKRVVFCGSCIEYDWSGTGKLVEDVTPLRPCNEYGAAKAALATAFGPLCAKLGLSAAWARPFFLYGPYERPSRLAADVIISLLEGREALCSHGEQKRDFLQVDDAAEAIVRLMWSDIQGPMNIGSGRAIPLRDLIEEAGRQTGRSDLIRLGAREARAGEPDLVEADTTRLQSVLGWRPRHTLQTGIADTIAWWRGELEGREIA